MAKKATKSFEGTVATFDFSNGTALTLDIKDVVDNIRTQLAGHGVLQKVGDSYAGAETVEEAIAAAQRVIEQLLAGEWRQAREGGGAPRVTMLAEALSRVMKARNRDVSIEEAREVIADMDDDTKAAVRKDPAIQVEMNKIKLERAEQAAAKGGESILDAL